MKREIREKLDTVIMNINRLKTSVFIIACMAVITTYGHEVEDEVSSAAGWTLDITQPSGSVFNDGSMTISWSYYYDFGGGEPFFPLPDDGCSGTDDWTVYVLYKNQPEVLYSTTVTGSPGEGNYSISWNMTSALGFKYSGEDFKIRVFGHCKSVFKTFDITDCASQYNPTHTYWHNSWEDFFDKSVLSNDFLYRLEGECDINLIDPLLPASQITSIPSGRPEVVANTSTNLWQPPLDGGLYIWVKRDDQGNILCTMRVIIWEVQAPQCTEENPEGCLITYSEGDITRLSAAPNQSPDLFGLDDDLCIGGTEILTATETGPEANLSNSVFTWRMDPNLPGDPPLPPNSTVGTSSDGITGGYSGDQLTVTSVTQAWNGIQVIWEELENNGCYVKSSTIQTFNIEAPNAIVTPSLSVTVNDDNVLGGETFPFCQDDNPNVVASIEDGVNGTITWSPSDPQLITQMPVMTQGYTVTVTPGACVTDPTPLTTSFTLQGNAKVTPSLDITVDGTTVTSGQTFDFCQDVDPNVSAVPQPAGTITWAPFDPPIGEVVGVLSPTLFTATLTPQGCVTSTAPQTRSFTLEGTQNVTPDLGITVNGSIVTSGQTFPFCDDTNTNIVITSEVGGNAIWLAPGGTPPSTMSAPTEPTSTLYELELTPTGCVDNNVVLTKSFTLNGYPNLTPSLNVTVDGTTIDNTGQSFDFCQDIDPSISTSINAGVLSWAPSEPPIAEAIGVLTPTLYTATLTPQGCVTDHTVLTKSFTLEGTQNVTPSLSVSVDGTSVLGGEIFELCKDQDPNVVTSSAGGDLGWSPSPPPSLTALGTESYVVTLTPSGCVTSLTPLSNNFSINGNPNLTPSITISGNTEACKDDVVALTATANDVTDYTISWTPNGETLSSISTDPVVEGANIYGVSLTTTDQCVTSTTADDTHTITVLAKPDPAVITVSSALSFAGGTHTGELGVMGLNIPNDPDFSALQWKMGSVPLSGMTTNQLAISDNLDYLGDEVFSISYVETNVDNCTFDLETDPVLLHTHPAIPTNLSAPDVGYSALGLDWDDMHKATRYGLSVIGPGLFENEMEMSEAIVSGLFPNTGYYISVKTIIVDNQGITHESPYSDPPLLLGTGIYSNEYDYCKENTGAIVKIHFARQGDTYVISTQAGVILEEKEHLENNNLFRFDGFYDAGNYVVWLDNTSPENRLAEIITVPYNYPCYNRVELVTYNELDEIVGHSKKFFNPTGNLVSDQWKDLSTNRFFTTAPLYDRLNRATGQSLPFPTNESIFEYRSDFIQDQGGWIYDHEEFDKVIPDPVRNVVEGTLGWYYSQNNVDEGYIPVSSFPFTKVEYYDDGTSEIKSSSQAGEPFINGTDKRTYTKTFPPLNDLQGEYAQIHKLLFGEEVNIASKSVSRDPNGQDVISYTDEGGNVLVTAYGFLDDEDLKVTISNENTPWNWDMNTQEYKVLDFYVPEGSSEVYVNGDFPRIINLLTGAELISGGGPEITATLSGGFYRCVQCNTIDYNVDYYNPSFNFYNSKGQLVASVAPLGVLEIMDPSFTIDGNSVLTLPYTTYYEFDFNGRAQNTFEVDAGLAEYIYRKDGSIRFSQNDLQKANGLTNGTNIFSYTNYDRSGRPVESGEYEGLIEFATLNDDLILEDISESGGIITDHQQESKDWVRTYYDLPDPQPSLAFEAPRDVLEYDEHLSYMDEVVATEQVVLKPGFTVAPGASFTVGIDPDNPIIPTPDFNLPGQEFTIGAVSYGENDHSKTWYSYDSEGRVSWMATWYKDVFSEPKIVEYQYDMLGNVTDVIYQRNGSGESFYHHYVYDEDLNLIEVYASKDPISSSNPLPSQLAARYEYYPHGPLKRVEYGDKLQGMDYVYTLQGWLKSINNPEGTDPGNDINPDVFAMTLNYFSGDYRSDKGINTDATTEEMYTGLITGQRWKNQSGLASFQTETTHYQYDGRYQLALAQTFDDMGNPEDKFKVDSLVYDANGNILKLRRNDENQALHDFRRLHGQSGYEYDPGTNKLASVYQMNAAGDAADLYASYSYDQIGQVVSISDGASSRNLKYNVTGKMIQYNEGANTNSYTYDDRGFRMSKEFLTSSTSDRVYVRDASGNILAIYEPDAVNGYQIDEIPVYGSNRLGLYDGSAQNINYELKDHLGNVRNVFSKNENKSELFADYYPFGLRMNFSTLINEKFGYQGEFAENDIEETGFNHFQLREYDPVIGRWLSIDPARQFWSPYIGMGNNPVVFYDPDGGCVDTEGFTVPCPDGIPEKGNEFLLILNEVTVTASVSNSTVSAVTSGPDNRWIGTMANTIADITPANGLAALLFGENGHGKASDFDRAMGAVELVPGGKLIQGVDLSIDATKPVVKLLTQGAKALHKHHVLPQTFRPWFKSRGISNINDYTILLSSDTHLKGVHGKGLGLLPGKWNDEWAKFINDNPNADPSQIFNHAENLLRKYGLEHLPYVPYR